PGIRRGDGGADPRAGGRPPLPRGIGKGPCKSPRRGLGTPYRSRALGGLTRCPDDYRGGANGEDDPRNGGRSAPQGSHHRLIRVWFAVRGCGGAWTDAGGGRRGDGGGRRSAARLPGAAVLRLGLYERRR